MVQCHKLLPNELMNNDTIIDRHSFPSIIFLALYRTILLQLNKYVTFPLIKFPQSFYWIIIRIWLLGIHMTMFVCSHQALHKMTVICNRVYIQTFTSPFLSLSCRNRPYISYYWSTTTTSSLLQPFECCNPCGSSTTLSSGWWGHYNVPASS